MGFGEALVLAVGLSMDALAVSICKGLSSRKASARQVMACGIWFGGFQALMPLAGFYLGELFLSAIEKYDHWVAFFLLAVVGINMLKEAREDSEEVSDDCSWRTMGVLALATSIDALAVGISLAMAQISNILQVSILIGVTTAVLSGVGVEIGATFGSRFRKQAQICGGVILLLLGVKILLEHLGG